MKKIAEVKTIVIICNTAMDIDEHVDALDQEILLYIDKDYQPSGEILIIQDSEDTFPVLLQKMVKYEP